MKLRELSEELNVKVKAMKEDPAAAKILGSATPETKLTDEQESQLRAVYTKPANAALPGAEDLVNRELSLLIVSSDRNQAISNEAQRLLSLYQKDGSLPSDDPQKAALIKAAGDRLGKRPTQWDGALLDLAAQVEVIDGEVFVPVIEISPTPTSLPSSSETPLKSAEVRAIAGGKD